MAISDVGDDSTSPLDGKGDVSLRDTSKEVLVDAASKCTGAASDITEGVSVSASTLIEGGAPVMLLPG